jgi:hypothetical protein
MEVTMNSEYKAAPALQLFLAELPEVILPACLILTQVVI